ncbi:curli-like amyloid fiber formation chaperone CsgH [Falsihalocynthiibacter sp. SS001]|uniref:curli-like amyloid fiber formation chaperone CsgH n=1 Tax=Falsihalocynthiibacter sp. SS001 TaxID=3349698 RepID=UPI0036D22908
MSPLPNADKIYLSVLDKAEAKTPTGRHIHCEIRGQKEAGILRLEGVVWADAELSGSYSFNLIRKSASGNSSTAQRGLFAVSPSQEKIIGSISVNAPAGHTYFAQLQVISGDTEVICDYKKA